MIILLIIIGAVFAASFAIITLRRKQYRARQKDVQIREDAAEKIRKSTEEILNNISSDFQSMPSWMDWDESVHRVGGQLDRIKRAACEDMSVLAYDPHYSMAKVAGNSGDIYLTSGKRCS